MQPSGPGQRPLGWFRRLLSRWSHEPNGGGAPDHTSMFNARVPPSRPPRAPTAPISTPPAPATPTAVTPPRRASEQGTAGTPDGSSGERHPNEAPSPPPAAARSTVVRAGLVRIHAERLDRTHVDPPRTLGQALELARRGRPPDRDDTTD